METNRLYSLANAHGVIIDRLSVPKNKSVSVKSDGKCFVCIDKDLSGANEKVCLAHELGHCVTSSFYNIYSSLYSTFFSNHLFKYTFIVTDINLFWI